MNNSNIIFLKERYGQTELYFQFSVKFTRIKILFFLGLGSYCISREIFWHSTTKTVPTNLQTHFGGEGAASNHCAHMTFAGPGAFNLFAAVTRRLEYAQFL